MPSIPFLIQSLNTATQSTSPLQRVSLDTPPYDEEWLQDLIDRHPSLVPAGEVEASFEDIIPVAREMPLRSGYLDNLYFTPDGYPVLVEVKLWKNQEARRKVIAQILEYAKDFSALNYQMLNAEIRKLLVKESWGDNPLFEIVSRNIPNPPEEAAFVDRVSRNLREGRFLLLIVGDGIREDMEGLANYLMHHSLRYAFGIIQIRFFTLPDGSVLALPDVMAKTQTIERHVTVVTAQGAGVTVSEPSPQAQTVTEKSEKTSLSLDDFFERMGKTSGESVSWLKSFIALLTDLPVEARVGLSGESLLIKCALRNGDTPTLIYISPPGAQFWGMVSGMLKKTPEGLRIIRAFLDKVASLVPGASVKVFEKTGNMDIKTNGKSVLIRSLQGKENELKEAIRDFIQSANAVDDAS